MSGLSDQITKWYDNNDETDSRGLDAPSLSAPSVHDQKTTSPSALSREGQAVAGLAAKGMQYGGSHLVDTGNPTINSGLIGGVSGGLNTAARGGSAEDVAKNAAIGAGIGTAGNIVSNALGPIGGTVFNAGIGIANSFDKYGNFNASQAIPGVATSILSAGAGALLGLPGVIASQVAAPMVRDSFETGLLGDAFDTRTNEQLRDAYEDNLGQFAGMEAYGVIDGMPDNAAFQKTQADLGAGDQSPSGKETLGSSLSSQYGGYADNDSYEPSIGNGDGDADNNDDDDSGPDGGNGGYGR